MIRKFVTFYKPYKKLFLIDMLCAVMVSVIDLAFPQILRYLTNNVFTAAGDIVKLIVFFAAGLVAMYIIRYFCQYFITSWGHIMGARMEGDMRQKLFNHYQRLSFTYYDKNNTGEMLSKLVTDLFDISELAHHGPENLLIATLKLIGSFTLLMLINVPITLILTAITAAMVVFSIIKNRQMHKVFTDNRRKIAGVNARVQDSLLGIKVIKSFANEELEHRKFDASNNAFLMSKSSSYKAMGIYHSVNSLFQGLLYIGALISGAFFVSEGSLKAMDFAMYFLYIGIFISPLEMLINFTEMFQRGFSGFRRFIEVIETKPEVYDDPHAEDIVIKEGVIEYKNVSFSYESHSPVLKNIDLTIEKNSTVALVGPSGGGKTTICSLLPRFYDLDGGQITIDGADIRKFSLKSLRRSIGIVQQDVYIFSGTIKENIRYGKPDATDDEITGAAKKANIHSFIATLPDGYDSYVGERGTRLSGGQKQRISIARVFLKNPDILILDEATSSLDNESEEHIQAALNELSKERTTIVIAHRLSTIRNADKICVINDGVVQECGTHRQLMSRNGLYAKYYNMQFEGIDEL
ncbi:MAG: ABC transporter ATP-binding protein [Christensenellales bacterium]|jgi:ATP-binding cassette subfamily B protein